LKAGNTAKSDHAADANSFRLERKPGVRERIEYLARQAQERIAEKRQRIEEQLWDILEADIGDFFEAVEVAKVDKDGKAETNAAGNMLTVKRERPRLLSDLPPDLRKAIEHVQVDARGNVVPQLYSNLQANAELRKMLNIGGQDRPETNASRLSDHELVRQLADQAKQLGVKIDLSYDFGQQQKPRSFGAKEAACARFRKPRGVESRKKSPELLRGYLP